MLSNWSSSGNDKEESQECYCGMITYLRTSWTKTLQNSLLMNGFVSGSGWAKLIVSCPFQFGSLKHSGYGTSDLKCVSRSGVVECGASVNTPLPLASFVFSDCPIGSVFVSPTFGLMTTPPLLGLVTG
jgi:hypothetical protein